MYISNNLSTEKAIGVPMIFFAIRIEVYFPLKTITVNWVTSFL